MAIVQLTNSQLTYILRRTDNIPTIGDLGALVVGYDYDSPYHLVGKLIAITSDKSRYTIHVDGLDEPVKYERVAVLPTSIALACLMNKVFDDK